jgi:hypothetical protein
MKLEQYKRVIQFVIKFLFYPHCAVRQRLCVTPAAVILTISLQKQGLSRSKAQALDDAVKEDKLSSKFCGVA